MFNDIENAIKKLRSDYPQYYESTNTLEGQSEFVLSVSWEDGEVDAYIKGDEDVLNDVDEETAFYEDVRNVQDMIINSQKINFEQ